MYSTLQGALILSSMPLELRPFYILLYVMLVNGSNNKNVAKLRLGYLEVSTVSSGGFHSTGHMPIGHVLGRAGPAQPLPTPRESRVGAQEAKIACHDRDWRAGCAVPCCVLPCVVTAR